MFSLDLRYGGRNAENPYDIIDGPWGGMGTKTWFTFSGYGRNVFEADLRTQTWARVWDAGAGAWREPTDSEKLISWPYKDSPVAGTWAEISFPVIKSVLPQFRLKDIVDAQPMANDAPAFGS